MPQAAATRAVNGEPSRLTRPVQDRGLGGDGAEVFEHLKGVGVAAPHVFDPEGEGGEVGHAGLEQRRAGQPAFLFPGAHGAQLAVERDRYRIVGVEPAAECEEPLAGRGGGVASRGPSRWAPSARRAAQKASTCEKATTPNSPGPGSSPTNGWFLTAEGASAGLVIQR